MRTPLGALPVSKPKVESTRMLALLMALLLVFSSAPPSVFAAPGRPEPAPHSKIARDLENLDPTSSVDVIIQFTRPPQDEDFAGAAKAGAVLRSKLGIINGGLFRVPAPALQGLAHNPNVRFISPDRALRSSNDISRDTVGANLGQLSGWTGKGVGVAVIDSGVSRPPDLDRQLVYSETFVQFPADEKYGHGTHVAGIIAGTGKDSSGTYEGIADGARIINLRVLDDTGAGRDSTVMTAIQRAVALKSQYNIRIINLSLGRQVMESHTLDPLCQAVKSAWQAGIVVVAAAGNQGRNNSAGNNGYGTIASPGNSPYVITVGALNTQGTGSVSDDVVTTYSSKGPTAIDRIAKPDLVAPGNRIVSVSTKGQSILEAQNLANKVTSAYFRMSGTSMAAAMVSGAVALLLEKEPTLTPDQVKGRLMKTARKTFPAAYATTDSTTGETFTVQHDIFTVGAGSLDIYAALSSNDVGTGTALSPTATQDPATGQTKLVYADGVVWGTSVIWGTAVVWGTSVIWGNSVIWGSSGTEVNGTAVIWGTSVIWGNSVIWGTGVIWGTAIIWGTYTGLSK